MFYTQYDSPVGPLALASDGTSLTELRFGPSPKQITDLPLFRAAFAWLDEYFLGRDPGPTPPLSPAGTAFQQRVWRELVRVPFGDTVSYGAAFTAERDMSIATVSIGYADGIPRLLSGRADVMIRGKRARIIGRICMDMCMVDITNIGDCAPGDEVEIFGGTVSVNELAERMGTINYELLCSVKNRVPRRYI